jgi:hypothetical protein
LITRPCTRLRVDLSDKVLTPHVSGAQRLSRKAIVNALSSRP